MKKNPFQIFLLFTVFLLIEIGSVNAQFLGTGSGTAAEPYQITSAAQLDEVRNNLAAHYKLMDDVDLTSWISAHSATSGWRPLGNATTPFSGTFNGNGHVISGLWINTPTSDNVGLFGYLKGAAASDTIKIQNLGVVIATQGIVGQKNVAGIAGCIMAINTTSYSSANTLIESCFVEGDITATDLAGGIVGRGVGNYILRNCYAGGGTISGTGGTARAGGLAGSAEYNSTVHIMNCYATNTIAVGASGTLAGGIIASAGGSSYPAESASLTVANCMAANPSITGPNGGSSTGRIIGWYKGGITIALTNYASEETSVNGVSVDANALNHKNGLNKSFDDLTNVATYTGLGWDFDRVWQMGNDYYQLPVLKNLSLNKQPTAAISTASLKIPDILSDNMVLQRNSTVRIWGKAKPGIPVNIQANWNATDVTVNAGDDGCWETNIQTGEAGGPYSIIISSDGKTKTINQVLLGEVWICAGQSNMTMPLKGWISDGMPIDGSAEAIAEAASYSNIRMITVARGISTQKEFNIGGTWQQASSAAENFSAIGYFYALELRKKLGVPVGMIHLSWPGSTIQAWTSYEVLQLFPEIDLATINQSATLQQRTPTVLYNAMFHPVAKFTAKGVVWYQGEDNVGAHALYAKVFPAMVQNWRNTLGLGNIPFYYVELAPYKYQGSNLDKGAFLREVQFQSQYAIPNVAMVTTGDVGEEENIHPAHKKEVAQRLAYWSLHKTYNFNDLPYTSVYTPVNKQKEIIGNKIILTFNCSNNGLVLSGDPKTEFEIAGDNNVFYPAEAVITGQLGDKLEIWSDNVSNPKHVHYCFRNYYQSVLFNNYMIPASPFRTETLSETSSAVNISNENAPFIYPNPTNGELFVRENFTDEKRLYNAVGNLVSQTNESHLDLSHFPSGIYYLVIQGKSNKIIKR